VSEAYLNKAYYLVVFDSTNQAIAAQKLLQDLDVTVMPTLREISASCGMSLRIRPELAQAAAERLRCSAVTDWRIYQVLQDREQLTCIRQEL